VRALLPLLFVLSPSWAAATPPEELAAALQAAPQDVLEAKRLRIDGSRAGLLGRHLRGGLSHAVLVSEAGRLNLGRADQVWVRGFIDLAGAGPLPTSLAYTGGLKRRGMARPALLVGLRTKSATKGSARSRAGTRRVETLLLVSMQGSPRPLLRTDVEVSAADGFGGHRVRRLTLEQVDGVPTLVGTRQDKLPARRARCLAPPPYPIRFELRGTAFRALPTQRPPGGCR
jgi:hypothetical protein